MPRRLWLILCVLVALVPGSARAQSFLFLNPSELTAQRPTSGSAFAFFLGNIGPPPGASTVGGNIAPVRNTNGNVLDIQFTPEFTNYTTGAQSNQVFTGPLARVTLFADTPLGTYTSDDFRVNFSDGTTLSVPVTVRVTAVPGPEAISLFGTGLAAIGLVLRRRR